MTLDTNILIEFLNGNDQVISTLSRWNSSHRQLHISTITVAEVLALPTLTPTDIRPIKTFLKDFNSTPVDSEIAESAAYLKRIYRISLADAIVASTALHNRTPLVTNDQGFKKISGLTVLTI